MRVYDLDANLEALIANGDWQVEIIGEDHCWTATVSRREWSNELQRYVYDEVGTCTSPSFLGVYDFFAQCITRDEDL